MTIWLLFVINAAWYTHKCSLYRCLWAITKLKRCLVLFAHSGVSALSERAQLLINDWMDGKAGTLYDKMKISSNNWGWFSCYLYAMSRCTLYKQHKNTFSTFRLYKTVDIWREYLHWLLPELPFHSNATLD